MIYLAAHKVLAAMIAVGLTSFSAITMSPFLSASRPPSMEMRQVIVDRSHTVRMGRYEVTRQDWRTCRNDGGCSYAPANLDDARYFEYPMVGISYLDAQEYIGWINRVSGHQFRLPNVIEWNAAAKELQRASFKKLFDDPRLAWAADYGAMPKLSPALKKQGGFGTFSNGISDLGGNVWEWTQTCVVAGEAPADCPAFYAEGEHEAKISEFIREPTVGGCASGTPPAHIGLRLVRDEAP
jgi:formylglycine-generating enzyme required for sulfatase activity